MSVRKIIYIGLCFSGFMCLRALAMTPASDAELAGVIAASCQICNADGGGLCSYDSSVLYDCTITLDPEVCMNDWCSFKIDGPSNNGRCQDDNSVTTSCGWNNPEPCIKYQWGDCMYGGIGMPPGCFCNSLSGGVVWTDGTRNVCYTYIAA